MTSLFGFSAPVDIDVRLEDEHERKQIDVKLDNPAKETLPVYFDGENVQGTVVIHPRNAKRLQHDGIKIELIGCIGMWLGSRRIVLRPRKSLRVSVAHPRAGEPR